MPAPIVTHCRQYTCNGSTGRAGFPSGTRPHSSNRRPQSHSLLVIPPQLREAQLHHLHRQGGRLITCHAYNGNPKSVSSSLQGTYVARPPWGGGGGQSEGRQPNIERARDIPVQALYLLTGGLCHASSRSCGVVDLPDTYSLVLLAGSFPRHAHVVLVVQTKTHQARKGQGQFCLDPWCIRSCNTERCRLGLMSPGPNLGDHPAPTAQGCRDHTRSTCGTVSSG